MIKLSYFTQQSKCRDTKITCSFEESGYKSTPTFSLEDDSGLLVSVSDGSIAVGPNASISITI